MKDEKVPPKKCLTEDSVIEIHRKKLNSGKGDEIFLWSEWKSLDISEEETCGDENWPDILYENKIICLKETREVGSYAIL